MRVWKSLKNSSPQSVFQTVQAIKCTRHKILPFYSLSVTFPSGIQSPLFGNRETRPDCDSGCVPGQALRKSKFYCPLRDAKWASVGDERRLLKWLALYAAHSNCREILLQKIANWNSIDTAASWRIWNPCDTQRHRPRLTVSPCIELPSRLQVAACDGLLPCKLPNKIIDFQVGSFNSVVKPIASADLVLRSSDSYYRPFLGDPAKEVVRTV